MYVCVVVVVVVEIITLYQVQTGRFLATTGYVAPSPNHVQNNVQEIIMYLTVATCQECPKHTEHKQNTKPAPWLRTPEPPRQYSMGHPRPKKPKERKAHLQRISPKRKESTQNNQKPNLLTRRAGKNTPKTKIHYPDP